MNRNGKKFKQIFANQKVAAVIMKMDQLFIKLPHLPKKLLSFINKVMPWLALVGGIIGGVTVVLSFLLTVLSLIALDFALIMTMAGSLLLVLLNTLFLVKAFKPLRNNDAVGWIYLFWANILGLVNTTISIVNGDIFGWQQISLTILMTIVGFYLLFEIGGYYEFKREEVVTTNKPSPTAVA
ncbi:MAG: hypothetical protein HOA24_05200 [Candidatus Pacebacteria bacterium]|mgnify:CR=1 FL=1|nr:hypothetical protein [Candidatus Paceibacterota bacterium]MBT3511495.1 hypothetical protein [Candidatus Paceibacterota bacterium]MBT4004653.1 hypothetical protein [Candidatus Paceibacterota bacterium]MBT4681049.1 hypothetical protein [Candidatus Paceibacterota bacterium]MBT6899358.1 hypothetical protein [Candidatus Paceibacterota bacterium]